MNTSTPCTELLSALLAARLAFPPITRNCEAWSPKSKKTYPYADLNAIIDATIPVLGAHGVLLVQAAEDGEAGMLCITTTLFHIASGQWMRSAVSVERPANPQDAGSAITYMKRYALAAILSISTEDDDAASLNSSSKAETSATAEPSRPPVSGTSNGHTPAPAQPKGGPKTLVQKSDLLQAIQAELTRIGRPVGEVTALYQAAFGTEVDTWDLVCGESLHTLKHGLAYLKTLTPEVSNGTQPASTQSTEAPATPAPAAEGLAVDHSPEAPEQPSAGASGSASNPVDTVESLVSYAVSLGLKEDVTRRVIHLHKDLAKCRTILTDAAERNARQVA